MDTIASFFFILPWGILFLGTLSFCIRSKKTRSQKKFVGLLGVAVCFSVYDIAYFLPEAPAAFIGKVDIFGHLVTPIFIFSAFRYLYYMHKPDRDLTRVNYLSIVALVVGVFCTLPYVFIGRDNAKDFWRAYMNTGIYPEQFIGDEDMQKFYFLDITLFHSICVLGLIGLIAYIIWCLAKDKKGIRHLWDFQWHNQEMTAFHLLCWLSLMLVIICIIRAGIGRANMIQHPILSIILSFGLAEIIYFICFLGTGIDTPDFTKSEILHPELFPLPDSQSYEAYKQRENVNEVEEEESKQKTKLDQLFNEERIFTNPSITLDDVAIRMNTNRVFVSDLIASAYGVSFRDYIHRLRIEYSKELMRKNPMMLQEDIAKKCGYNDAATFNKRFRIQEGVTPKQWRTILNQA